MVKAVKILDNIDPVAVGDRVQYLDAHDGTGMIVQILPRRSKLTRRSAVPMPTAHPFEQVIVANLDQVVAVFAAAYPTPKWNLLDRYLVSAESLDLSSLICITKIDLLGEEGLADLLTVAQEYRRIGYRVILTSVVSQTGMNEIEQALQAKASVLVGKSGVGKSSLLNAIEPGLGLRVNEVNQATGKGKHTTTHMEMFALQGGGTIIDTPGVREFGLWEIEGADLALYFPEMRAAVGKCRFGLDCQHENEPGCAIRKAVETGHVSPRRYQSYLTLKAEIR
jgi:ribosome biogenesis GTPase